ncbi:hypothetical protein PUN28_015490 [Cardiocondyla obscurior]|uniref:Uncharacterized protein n=1 Tax=Cardiocondyla obscurior TaxID=286306 RepID=A0AAW2EWM0_9HYME
MQILRVAVHPTCVSPRLIYSVHASANCFWRTCGFIERRSNIKRRGGHTLFHAGPGSRC